MGRIDKCTKPNERCLFVEHVPFVKLYKGKLYFRKRFITQYTILPDGVDYCEVRHEIRSWIKEDFLIFILKNGYPEKYDYEVE